MSQSALQDLRPKCPLEKVQGSTRKSSLLKVQFWIILHYIFHQNSPLISLAVCPVCALKKKTSSVDVQSYLCKWEQTKGLRPSHALLQPINNTGCTAPANQQHGMHCSSQSTTQDASTEWRGVYDWLLISNIKNLLPGSRTAPLTGRKVELRGGTHLVL